MRKTEKIFLICILVEAIVIYISALLIHAVFQVCVWLSQDLEIAKKILEIAKSITFYPALALLLVSFLFRIFGSRPGKKLSHKTVYRLEYYCRNCAYILFLFYPLILIRDRYAGHPMNEFEIARDIMLLTAVDGFLLSLTIGNLGLFKKS